MHETEIAELINAFANEKQSIMKTVEALVQFGDESIQPLLDAVYDQTASIHLRIGATRIVGLLGNPKAIKPLVAILGDKVVGLMAGVALCDIGKEGLPLI